MVKFLYLQLLLNIKYIIACNISPVKVPSISLLSSATSTTTTPFKSATQPIKIPWEEGSAWDLYPK